MSIFGSPGAEFLSRSAGFSCVQVDDCNGASLTAGFGPRRMRMGRRPEPGSWRLGRSDVLRPG